MSPTELSTVVGLLAALSAASERLVEVFKGFFPLIDQKQSDPAKEAARRAKLHGLAFVAGIVTAVVSSFAFPDAVKNLLPGDWTDFRQYLGTMVLGILASGGSGFWNSILDYVNKAKDLKAKQAGNG